MGKSAIPSNAFLCPMPMTVVSAVVAGKVNHLAVAWVSRTNHKPPMIGIALGRSHLTNRGIREHGEFGVSIPSVDQVAEADYVGLVSGAEVDKSGVFAVFYGSLPHAPMIASCPVTMACRLVQVVDLPTNEFLIGEIVEAYCEEDCLTDGQPDPLKIRPFTLTMPDNRYWRLGSFAGRAWSIGEGYRPKA